MPDRVMRLLDGPEEPAGRTILVALGARHALHGVGWGRSSMPLTASPP